MSSTLHFVSMGKKQAGIDAMEQSCRTPDILDSSFQVAASGVGKPLPRVKKAWEVLPNNSIIIGTPRLQGPGIQNQGKAR